jgi:hypothetical protein
MNATQIQELARVAIAAAGALSIFCGYKLFCEIPFGRNRTVLIINGVSGAVLALFGMAILVGDVRSLSNNPGAQSHQTAHHTKPAEAGSFTVPGIDHRKTTADWAI